MRFRSFSSVGVIFVAIAFLLLSASCQQSTVLPSVTPSATNTYFPGKFIWHDLVTRDPAAARRFYGEVFGWTFETLKMGKAEYTVIKNGGRAIGGIFPLPVGASTGSTAEWVSAMSVASVQNAVNTVKARGGVAVDRIQDFAGRGTSAVVADPQGAILSFLRSPVGDPVDKEANLNEWLWTELWSTDPAASKAFYESLVGYRSEHVKDGVHDYWLLKNGDAPRAGIIKNPSPEMRSTWVPYIRVSDPSAIAEKVKAAGGMVLVDASPDLRNGNVAILRDPTGAPFVVQKWPM